MRIEQLTGKVVVVTGAASGIGRETALAFARAGARLVVTDISPQIEATRAAVEALGASCISRQVDVTSDEAMQELAATVHAEFGPVTVLVNNAGIGYLGGLLDTPLDIWRRQFEINVMGVVHGIRHFLPAMQSAPGPSRIVNVSSLAGFAPAPNMSAYAASKHAVVGLSQSLSLELAGTPVGVTTVCPGVIKTPIVSNRALVSPAISDRQLARLQRYYQANGCSPEVVADAIVDAVRVGRELVMAGPLAKPTFYLQRLSRRLVRRLSLWSGKRAGYL